MKQSFKEGGLIIEVDFGSDIFKINKDVYVAADMVFPAKVGDLLLFG